MSARLNPTHVNPARLNLPRLHSARLNLAHLNPACLIPARLNLARLNAFQLNQFPLSGGIFKDLRESMGKQLCGKYTKSRKFKECMCVGLGTLLVSLKCNNKRKKHCVGNMQSQGN